ncbi:hypothetical protein [Nocardia jejuensis]|uniref:hypothetical protein n=1 Tax=Nocardia jejuensis TaxID=328049 RepID=UPI000831F6CD|nr:hypothetical protein [Nocardia jejuensis]
MSGELEAELQRLESERLTGVLRAGDGAFHLTEGTITSADCRRTIALDRLAVEAGVLTAEDWRKAETGDAGALLTRPRLETLAVLSVYDAAYFLLSSSSKLEFRPAPPHWLAPVCHIPPHALVREFARRGDPQSGPWPAELVDRAPVVPVRRIRRKRLALTGGQTEVLAAADGRRNVATIARDLGRTTYGCLVAVRDLTAAGLIEPPSPMSIAAGDPVVESVASVATGPTPPLRRRQRPVLSVPAADRWQPVDPDVLVRVRAALEGLA